MESRDGERDGIVFIFRLYFHFVAFGFAEESERTELSDFTGIGFIAFAFVLSLLLCFLLQFLLHLFVFTE